MKCPESANILFHEHNAAVDCRDSLLKMRFFDKKAIRFASIANRSANKAWKIVNKTYPETKKGEWTWDCKKEEILKDETQ